MPRFSVKCCFVITANPFAMSKQQLKPSAAKAGDLSLQSIAESFLKEYEKTPARAKVRTSCMFYG